MSKILSFKPYIEDDQVIKNVKFIQALEEWSGYPQMILHKEEIPFLDTLQNEFGVGQNIIDTINKFGAVEIEIYHRQRGLRSYGEEE
jgi:hypothetical protein